MENQTKTELCWEEARGCVGSLGLLCPHSVLIGTVAQKGTVGVPARCCLGPRQTPSLGTCLEARKRLLFCSF